MIQIVRFTSVIGNRDDLIVLRRSADGSSITVALPFHEDTPNLLFSIPEALNLGEAINDLISVPLLKAPLPPIVDETVISYKLQSELSGLFDRYPSDSEADRTARKALHEAIHILGL
ncbi:hypothetical protein [Paenibacillus sp. AN1007]|uniref:Uncharacterized protein n=1 Tax=Paenibacillus sp. AN1007 TaxID=3151385 RepID=A0AAU8NGM1_9BACL